MEENRCASIIKAGEERKVTVGAAAEASFSNSDCLLGLELGNVC